MELLLPGVDPQLRQQHQHARGRLPPLGLPLRADRHAQPLRAGEGPPAREGRRPDGRRRARGPDRRHLREAAGPAVRRPDQDQARQPGHGRLRPEHRQPRAGRVPRGEPARGQARPRQGRLGRPGPRRRPQGARPHAPQVRARELRAAGQARGLLDPRPGADRAVHRRGRLRGRLRQAGPRPLDPGGAAAARQDPQRREGAHRQGAAEQRDPGAHHRARLGRARRLRHRALALPQDRPDDGRGRRRRPHPDADPHAAVPRDAGADRGRLRLHRQAAALQAHPGPAGALHREGVRARGDPARRQARQDRGCRRRRLRLQAHRQPLAALSPAAQAVRGLGLRAEGRVRRRHRDVPRGVADPRRADPDRRGPDRARRARGPGERAVHHGAGRAPTTA